MNYWTNGVSTLHQADAREIPLPDASVHCVVTSPPYWGLRYYGLEAGIGLEPTLGEWVENVVEVMREVRRVLRDDGTVWLNLGDAYSGGGRGTNTNGMHGLLPEKGSGLEPKNLMGQPWRVAFALQDDGWILRSAIVWHKPNPMPESVTDRPTSAYEMVFLLSKQGRYFYDAEAVREESKKQNAPRGDESKVARLSYFSNPRVNARNVWTIPTQGRPDAHFATFTDELPRRCILAGTSEHGVCVDCGAPWVLEVDRLDTGRCSGGGGRRRAPEQRDSKSNTLGVIKETQAIGWRATCDHNANTVPATVLDPFVGSGTSCAIAQTLGRRSIGLDLNPEYLDIAAKRIGAVSLPLI